MEGIDPEKIAGILPGIRYMVFRKTWAGWSIAPRVIHDHEFVLITAGKGVITVEGAQFPVGQGNFLYFYPELRHSLQTDSKNPMQFLAAHFSFSLTDFRGVVSNCPEKLPLEPVFTLKEYHKVFSIFKQLHDMWMESRMMHLWRQNILFEQLTCELLQDVYTKSYQPENVLRIGRALEHINHNYMNIVRVGGLARIAGLSPAYFIRIFHEVTGTTPLAYVNRVRIENSKDMLINSAEKISRISSKCGFDDEFYFCRVFKKMERVSPSEFRLKNSNYADLQDE